MNVLILGSGGREHAIAWKLAQSPTLNTLYIAPGNAGTTQVGTNVKLDILDFPQVKDFCLDKGVDLILVGPEAPLVEGIYDAIKEDESTQHIIVIGPSKEGAQLEGSKAYSKVFMAEQGIPTASYLEVTADNLQEGLDHLKSTKGPYVLKADGLAAGKGVLIIDDVDEACQELESMLGGKFGQASAKVVIEEFLDGIEFSVFALTDGKSYHILPVAKDYKRIGEGDTGLNTGGMGAVSPPPFVDDVMMQKVKDRIIEPTIQGLQKRNITYKGFVFFGLISVQGEPYVIEYNCRMGDPETEVVMPRIESDFLPVLAAIDGPSFAEESVEETPETATTVFLVSGGYPEAYEKGKVMTGFNEVDRSILFHAGTKQSGNDVITNGGRVLAVTSLGETMHSALSQSMENAEKITFEGKYYRTDIGHDL